MQILLSQVIPCIVEKKNHIENKINKDLKVLFIDLANLTTQL